MADPINRGLTVRQPTCARSAAAKALVAWPKAQVVSAELRIAQRAIRERTLPGILALRDDGLDDALWTRLNPGREYRVRPHRLSDGEPALHRFPCVTVLHIPTGASGRGIPSDALKRPGGAVYPVNADWWGHLLFTVYCETDGFKKPWVEGQT